MHTASEIKHIASLTPQQVYDKFKPSFRVPADVFRVLIPFVRELQEDMSYVAKHRSTDDTTQMSLLSISALMERKAYMAYHRAMMPVLIREFPNWPKNRLKTALKQRWAKLTKEAYY